MTVMNSPVHHLQDSPLRICAFGDWYENPYCIAKRLKREAANEARKKAEEEAKKSGMEAPTKEK